MLQHVGTQFIRLGPLQHLINVDASLGVVALLEEYPSVGIKISGIIRFSLDGTIAHLLGFVQIATLQREVVGIIIEYPYIIGVVL